MFIASGNRGKDFHTCWQSLDESRIELVHRSNGQSFAPFCRGDYAVRTQSLVVSVKLAVESL